MTGSICKMPPRFPGKAFIKPLLLLLILYVPNMGIKTWLNYPPKPRNKAAPKRS